MQYLVANWKSEKNYHEVKQWCFTFLDLLGATQHDFTGANLNIVIAPSFPYLRFVKQVFSKIPYIFVGAQDISENGSGKFTGYVSAKQISDFCEYVIIGHSERRTHAQETEDQISRKLEQAYICHVKPILCVRGVKDSLHTADIISYEPVESIGTGKNTDAKRVSEMRTKLGLDTDASYLYGGSVDKKNISEYLKIPSIQGFLVGTASLDPDSFYSIAVKMVEYSK